MNTDKLIEYAQYASYGIAGLVVFLHGIAPLTKSDKDDKLLNALRWVEDKLMMLLPSSPKPPAPPAE